MNKLDEHDHLVKRRTFGRLDDFETYLTGGVWTTTTGGSGSASAAGKNGLLTLACVDSTTNREVYVATTASLFLIEANKPLICEMYARFDEANTNKANIAFGFMSSVGAASIADTTGEPKSSYSGAVIYKVPGGTTWKTQSSIGTTQTTTATSKTAGGAYQVLRIEIMPVSSTIAEISYFVNGLQLMDTASIPRPIKDSVTYTGVLAMQLFACCKNGSTSAESLLVDYMAYEQLRAPLWS